LIFYNRGVIIKIMDKEEIEGIKGKICRLLKEYDPDIVEIAPSTDYHSAIFCNSSFELIPNETTIPTKSTCRQTNFSTERFV